MMIVFLSANCWSASKRFFNHCLVRHKLSKQHCADTSTAIPRKYKHAIQAMFGMKYRSIPAHANALNDQPAG